VTEAPAIARVFDLETTGLPEDEASRICDVGLVDVDLTKPDFPLIEGSAWTRLIHPGCPIPPEVSAIHHIVDEDVANAPGLDIAFAKLDEGLTDDDIYVAHNAKFEQHFFPTKRRWIDTYRCALRAWPDAPNHTNQVLRYWLGLDVDRRLADPPHRAWPDAYVTAHILRKLLLLRPVERLIQISTEPGFLPKLQFGKHYGEPFKTVERSYLEWIVGQKDMDEDVVFTAKYWLERR
jgi:exodeoxyribonuclease X